MHIRRSMVALVAWAVGSIACAVSEPPSGGPEDKAPPTVAATVPRTDSTGVDTKSAIRIRFSEPMRKARIERLVTVSPVIEIARVGWEGDELVIQPAGELVRDTTYVVRVRPDYQDRHGVPGAKWHEFAFATGSAPLDTARIEGKVTLKRAPATKAIVRAFRIAEGDTLDFVKSRPARDTGTDRQGEYGLRYLPSDGARFVVMAFLDQNDNRAYERDSDPAAVYPDTLVIAAATPVITGIDLALVDPKEPGTVKGTVVNESGIDTARVMVAMYDVSDSTRAEYRALCDSTGAYQVASVKPGTYSLHAFVDVKTDSLPGSYPCPSDAKGCAEPAVRRPGVLKVGPGEVITESSLVIRRKEEP